MPKPDTEGRYDILRLQLRGKAVAPDVDLLQLARDLPGLVGADLANIINEAQLHGEGGGSCSSRGRNRPVIVQGQQQHQIQWQQPRPLIRHWACGGLQHHLCRQECAWLQVHWAMAWAPHDITLLLCVLCCTS